MQLKPEEQEDIRRYLLGQISPEEQDKLEERLMKNADSYEELLISEDELIDQYLADDLSETERRHFESNFLVAPERQQKLRFARSLQKYVYVSTPKEGLDDVEAEDASERARQVKEVKPKKPFWFLPFQNPIIAYSVAATLLLGVVGISWLAYESQRRGPDQLLAVNLTPGLMREGGETKTIQVPPAITTVRLQLALPAAEYQSYRAELLNSERTSVLVKDNLKPEISSGASTLTFDVPARSLTRDDYRVKLAGLRPDGSYEDIAGYTFRVVP